MQNIRSIFARLRRDERGATAIEYGLIAALVSVAIIGAATSMGNGIKETFTTIGDRLGGTAPTPGADT